MHHSIIGRDEREEAKPTIDVVVMLAKILDTTVGYLLGESEDKDLLKDPAMLKRLNEIEKMDNEGRRRNPFTNRRFSGL